MSSSRDQPLTLHSTRSPDDGGSLTLEGEGDRDLVMKQDSLPRLLQMHTLVPLEGGLSSLTVWECRLVVEGGVEPGWSTLLLDEFARRLHDDYSWRLLVLPFVGLEDGLLRLIGRRETTDDRYLRCRTSRLRPVDSGRCRYPRLL